MNAFPGKSEGRYCNALFGARLVRGRARTLFLAAACLLAFSPATRAQTNVITQHNDISRTGANTTETILTPANVNNSTFGKIFSVPVDGRVYAQPLYLKGLTMGAGTPQAGTTHNVIFIATEHDSVYAFDADFNGGANAAPLWQITLLDAAHGATGTSTPVPNSDVSTADIVPEIGITGTGTIDTSTNTLYLVGKVKQTAGTVGSLSCSTATPCYVQRLHALDVTTGAEKFGGPVRLSASVPGTGNGSSGGTLNWDPLWEHNRPGLLLLNGIVYLGFAAHGDNGPWHGWILAYNATSLAQTGVWCSSPKGIGSGIWMSGSGLAADLPAGVPFGRMFVATGNGDYNTGAPPYTNTTDYGDSIVALSLTNGVPTVSDEYTPSNQANLNSGDTDVAAGGVLILPDQAGAHPHEAVQVGKEGKIWVLNREGLGGYSTTSDNILQDIAGVTSGLWSMPAYWNGHIYEWGVGSDLKAFSVTSGVLSSSWTSAAVPVSNFPGATPSVSANGNTNGVVWAIRTDAYNSTGPAILYAFDATNVATELYASSTEATDTAGAAVKFAVPTISNGKVYVGTAGEVDVYGLFANSPAAATPVITPGSELFTGTLNVTITDTTSGATIYYTEDGSTPTRSSNVYTGPIPITSTTTIKALANAGAALEQSAVASQTYTAQTQTLTPTFSPAGGSYASTQTVTISDATAGAKIYYTTNGNNPTTSSTLYSGPLTISGTTPLNAIATSSTLSQSLVASALYTIVAGGTGVDFSNGFSSAATTMTFNGSTDLDDTRLQLTNGGTNEAGSAWANTPVNIQSFTTDFNFQLSNADGDGIAFVIQGVGPTALGPSGGGLGYGPDTPGGAPGILSSVAVKFDLYSNAGEGDDSTGLYTNGVSPTTPAVDLTSSGIDLHSGDTMNVHIAYDGTTLTLTINDTVVDKTFTTSWPVNIPGVVGANTAYVGFTGGTGGSTSSQKIETWTFVSSGGVSPSAAVPTFSLAAGTYLGTQTVSLSDTTSGAAIYYTTDGSTPTTGSNKYSAAITVTASETIKAIAAASGFSNSAVGSAAYVIESQVAPPVISPAGGIYASAQSVTISSTASGAAIYYTTNGMTPTTSSTLYAGPIAVNASETITAIATASGFFNSNPVSAAYTIGSSVTSVNLGSGFSAGSMVLNGNATLSGTRLRVTDGNANEASSAWYIAPANIQHFTTNFTFQNTGGSTPQADGFAFVIQGGANTALGPLGGGLGYGPDAVGGAGGILNSVAVKFDLYANSTEGTDSTGLYVNGASPTVPSVDLTSSGINLHSADIFNVLMTYDGTNLTMTITDTTTQAAFTQTWPINIPSTVGGNSAYVGFTGGTGGDTVICDIIGWTLNSTAGVAATPVISPAGGGFSSPQTVTISDTTSGAIIHYTTNGSTPLATSPSYAGAITVSSSETIEAIAVASGFSNSPVATATFTITTPAATPVFTPVSGTYNAPQSVAISDATAGATIYYTTDNSTPTATSTKYTGAITVSSSQTIKAIAVATGFSNSNVGSAAYTIISAAATPVISPATNSYTAAQNVSITDSTSGAVIHFTTDGTLPGPTSPVYTTGFTVSVTTTVKAIAVAAGFSNSATATSVITISGVTAINFGSGFSAANLALNGSAVLNGTRLRLTDTGTNEGGSAWFVNPVNIQQFTTDFTFQLTTPIGNGIAFVIQNVGPKAVGPSGGGLGYGPDNIKNASASAHPPITQSVAVKFDLHDNAGEGPNSTGLYVNGASPTVPATTLANGVNLHSGDIFKVHITYDGTTLVMAITDTTNAAETFTTSWPVNIPANVNANTAYIGFTGGTGSSTSIQEIINWTYSNSVAAAKTPVVYPTTALPAVSSGPTFRTFNYSLFPDANGTIIDATKVGDNVTFTVNVAAAGTYDVQLSYKKFNTRGISQLSINGANQGATLDQYVAGDGYGIVDYGTFNFATAGNYTFKFTVTGKNAASSSYSVSFDDITLTPQ